MIKTVGTDDSILFWRSSFIRPKSWASGNDTGHFLL